MIVVWKRTRYPLAISAALALILPGCGGKDTGRSNESGPHEPRLGSVVTVRSGAQLTLPMDAYYLTPEQHIKINHARGAYLRSCMKRFGLDFRSQSLPVARYPKNAVQLGWRSELASSKYGYHGTAEMNERMARASQAQQEILSVPPEQVPVFDGKVSSHHGVPVPQGGCMGEYQRRIDAGFSPRSSEITQEDGPELSLQRLEEKASVGAREHSRFHALNRDWSRCMASSGFRYADPEDAEGSDAWGLESTEPEHVSQSEIKTAVADDSCRIRVNYSGVLRSITAAYQHRIISEKPDLLRELKDWLQTRLRNSADIRA